MALGKIAGEQRIRRRADQRADAADAGAIGKAEQQGPREAMYIGALVAMSLSEHGDHRACDRKHQDNGGGIADPHGNQAGGDHEAEHQPARFGADRLHDGIGEAAMEAPALDAGGEQETAEKQKDQRIGIGCGGGVDVALSDQRQQDER